MDQLDLFNYESKNIERDRKWLFEKTKKILDDLKIPYSESHNYYHTTCYFMLPNNNELQLRDRENNGNIVFIIYGFNYSKLLETKDKKEVIRMLKKMKSEEFTKWK